MRARLLLPIGYSLLGPQNHRRRNLIVPIAFHSPIECLDEGVRNGHKQNHGRTVILSWI